MYHYQSSSCWIDGTDIRPDALLASGGAFLPLGNHHHQQQQLQENDQLTPGIGMASFRRVLSNSADEEEQQQPRLAVAPPMRYSAEERRERIDKYRSKRNQRNFQKKITYACRKTLADSRPRVKGRFARGGGENHASIADQEAEVVLATTGISMSESPSVNDSNGSNSTDVPDWCLEMQEASVDLDNLCDEEMLAAYLGVSSISLYSPSSSASGQ